MRTRMRSLRIMALITVAVVCTTVPAYVIAAWAADQAIR